MIGGSVVTPQRQSRSRFETHRESGRGPLPPRPYISKDPGTSRSTRRRDGDTIVGRLSARLRELLESFATLGFLALLAAGTLTVFTMVALVAVLAGQAVIGGSWPVHLGTALAAGVLLAVVATVRREQDRIERPTVDVDAVQRRADRALWRADPEFAASLGVDSDGWKDADHRAALRRERLSRVLRAVSGSPGTARGAGVVPSSEVEKYAKGKPIRAPDENTDDAGEVAER